MNEYAIITYTTPLVAAGLGWASVFLHKWTLQTANIQSDDRADKEKSRRDVVKFDNYLERKTIEVLHHRVARANLTLANLEQRNNYNEAFKLTVHEILSLVPEMDKAKGVAEDIKHVYDLILQEAIGSEEMYFSAVQQITFVVLYYYGYIDIQEYAGLQRLMAKSPTHAPESE